MNSLRRQTLLVAGHQRRAYTQSSPLYQYVLKSNATYVTFILLGAAIGGGLYSAAGDFIWKSVNRGRLYDQIDWSKWNSKWKSE
jgi:hypothetical protein